MAILIPSFELAEKIGHRVEIDADTVGELVDECISRFGEPFREAVRASAIVVNGRSVNLLKGRRTRLKHDDSVWLIRPASGG